MSEPPGGRERALELMLAYLKDQHANQLAALRDVDSKMTQRLTVCAAAVGLVTIGLPIVARSSAPLPVLVVAVLAVVFFGLSLLRMLWLVMWVLEVKVCLPGFSAPAFERAASCEDLGSVAVLEELVVNYARAVEGNAALIEQRGPSRRALRFWGKCTVVAAFVTAGFLGIVYLLSAPPSAPKAEESIVVVKKSDDDGSKSNPQAEPPEAPATKKVVIRPSLLAPPRLIDLGDAFDPATEQDKIHIEDKSDKK